MNAVEVKKLTKKYKSNIAVNNIDFTIQEGELFALLGVNGAGKTTTVRMLCGLSTPTSGECFVCGKNCITERAAVKKIVGISPQDTAVAENLTVFENLQLMCGLYGYSKEQQDEKIRETMKLFRLDDIKDAKVKTLSGGWKRKVSIAMALISEPKVLFLDEPTLGLDVLARRDLWKILEKLKGNVTMILTTHYMEEAEHLADRIAIMMQGKIAVIGTLFDLENASGKKGLENVFVEIAEKEIPERYVENSDECTRLLE